MRSYKEYWNRGLLRVMAEDYIDCYYRDKFMFYFWITLSVITTINLIYLLSISVPDWYFIIGFTGLSIMLFRLCYLIGKYKRAKEKTI